MTDEKLYSKDPEIHDFCGCRRYLGYGIAFSGKSCAVAGKALTPADR